MILKIIMVSLTLFSIHACTATIPMCQVVLSIWGICFALSALARSMDPLPHIGLEQFIADWGPIWWHAFAVGCAVIWFFRAHGIA